MSFLTMRTASVTLSRLPTDPTWPVEVGTLFGGDWMRGSFDAESVTISWYDSPSDPMSWWVEASIPEPHLVIQPLPNRRWTSDVEDWDTDRESWWEAPTWVLELAEQYRPEWYPQVVPVAPFQPGDKVREHSNSTPLEVAECTWDHGKGNWSIRVLRPSGAVSFYDPKALERAES